MKSNKSPRKTTHIDFVSRFAKKLQTSGHIVYTGVSQDYWDVNENRTVNGKIDIVAVKQNQITAYELESVAPQKKSRLKLSAFDCNAAYIICLNGDSLRVK